MSNAYEIRVDPKAAIPLATQLSQQFSWLIISGALDEGEELPPIQQLADELEINVHTVRAGYQQLAANQLVSLGRGRKARVLGFDRSKPRDSGGKVPSYSIGVIIPEFVSFYAPFLAGIEAEAATQPAMVFVANAREDETTALRYLDRLVAKGVDGIIVAAALVRPEATLPPPGQPPIVYVDAPGAPGPSVEFDLVESQHLATGHLIEHGHQRIGYITPPVALPNVAPKLTGHNKALEVGGIEPDQPPLPQHPTPSQSAHIKPPETMAYAYLTILQSSATTTPTYLPSWTLRSAQFLYPLSKQEDWRSKPSTRSETATSQRTPCSTSN